MIFWEELVHSIGMYPLLYLALLAALGIAAAALTRAAIWWARGRPAGRRGQVGRRLARVVTIALAHQRALRRPLGGVMHLLIMGGALLWGAATLLTHYVYVNGDLFEAAGPAHLASDLGLLALLVGLILAVARRLARQVPHRAEDGAVLGLGLGLALAAWFAEGLFIRLADPPWAESAFLSGLVAKALKDGSPDLARSLYAWSWQLLHAGFIALLAWLPLTKLRHLAAAPAAVYAGNLEPPARWEALDLEDEAAPLGIGEAADLTWKSRLDADACTRCGRCTAACPAQRAGQGLDPYTVLMAAAPDASGQSLAERAGGEAIWACTACLACETVCPVSAEPLRIIAGLRRQQVLATGQFPPHLQEVCRGLERQGNPWALAADLRLPLDAPTLAPGDQTDVLLWVGCAGAYDPEAHAATEALVRILRAAGVDFATLGEDERCCGDAARRIGSEDLWQSLARENIAALQARRFRRIVTLCPHGYNTLAHEYPQLGGEFAVRHATSFVAELLAQGRLRLRPASGEPVAVAYQDPCTLGRGPDAAAPARALLAALPGVRLAELSPAGREALCCGGGGGQAWMERPAGQRVNALRAQDVAESGAALCATACPYCQQMLRESLADLPQPIPARDVIALVAEALDAE